MVENREQSFLDGEHRVCRVVMGGQEDWTGLECWDPE